MGLSQLCAHSALCHCRVVETWAHLIPPLLICHTERVTVIISVGYSSLCSATPADVSTPQYVPPEELTVWNKFIWNTYADEITLSCHRTSTQQLLRHPGSQPTGLNTSSDRVLISKSEHIWFSFPPSAAAGPDSQKKWAETGPEVRGLFLMFPLLLRWLSHSWLTVPSEWRKWVIVHSFLLSSVCV